MKFISLETLNEDIFSPGEVFWVTLKYFLWTSVVYREYNENYEERKWTMWGVLILVFWLDKSHEVRLFRTFEPFAKDSEKTMWIKNE